MTNCSPTTPTPSRPVVLVIDDESAFRTFAAKAIGRFGWEVLTAENAEVGLALAAEAEPAVILLDLQMPGYDGVEVLRALATAGCRSTVVLVSGFDLRVLQPAVQVGRNQGLAMGGHLEKPFDLRALEAVLREAVAAGRSVEPDATAPDIGP